MRIIAGLHRGRRLKTPAGSKLRPTSDRVKEAIFNILGPRVRGAVVLDLFSGTGNLALEAVSRGAQEAVCVEKHPAALRLLQANVQLLGETHRVEIWPGPVERALPALARQGRRFDIIFLDPPYRTGLVAVTVQAICAHGLLGAGGLVVAEHAVEESLAAVMEQGDLELFTRRTYGDTAVTFLVSPRG